MHSLAPEAAVHGGRPSTGATMSSAVARRTRAGGQPDGAASSGATSQRWARKPRAWRACAVGARAWRAAQAEAAAVRGHPGQAVPGVDRGRRARRAAQVQPPRLGAVPQAQEAQPAAAARAGVGVPGDRDVLRARRRGRVGLEGERPRPGRLAAAQLPYVQIRRVLPDRHGRALPELKLSEVRHDPEQSDRARRRMRRHVSLGRSGAGTPTICR